MGTIYRTYAVADDCKALPGEADGASILRGKIITTEARDRMRDIVRTAGARLEHYLTNPQVKLEHGMSGAVLDTIGRTTALAQHVLPSGRRGITADVEFASHDLAREVRDMVVGGFMPAASIGFRPIERRIIGPDGMPTEDLPKDYDGWMPDGYGFEFLSWELVEWSVVGVPANPEAVGVLRSMPTLCKALDIDRPVRVFNAGLPDPPDVRADGKPRVPVADIGWSIAHSGPEVCPGCGQVEVFVRPVKRFLPHHKGADLCPVRELADREPNGLSFRRVLELVGNSLGNDAGRVREEMIAKGDIGLPLDDAVAQATGRAAAIDRAVKALRAEVEKAGRVLSSANETKIRAALSALDDLDNVASVARDALKGVLEAAGLLAPMADETDEPVEESTEPEATKADGAELRAAVLARLEDPAVIAAMESLARRAATRKG